MILDVEVTGFTQIFKMRPSGESIFVGLVQYIYTTINYDFKVIYYDLEVINL